jgi:hypothetical protein
MFLNESGHHISVAGQGVDGQIFIFTHEATVYSNIGAQDGGQFAFIGLGGHDFTPFKKGNRWTGRIRKHKKPLRRHKIL